MGDLFNGNERPASDGWMSGRSVAETRVRTHSIIDGDAAAAASGEK